MRHSRYARQSVSEMDTDRGKDAWGYFGRTVVSMRCLWIIWEAEKH